MASGRGVAPRAYLLGRQRMLEQRPRPSHPAFVAVEESNWLGLCDEGLHNVLLRHKLYTFATRPSNTTISIGLDLESIRMCRP